MDLSEQVLSQKILIMLRYDILVISNVRLYQDLMGFDGKFKLLWGKRGVFLSGKMKLFRVVYMICFEFVEGLIYNKRSSKRWNNANKRTKIYLSNQILLLSLPVFTIGPFLSKPHIRSQNRPAGELDYQF